MPYHKMIFNILFPRHQYLREKSAIGFKVWNSRCRMCFGYDQTSAACPDRAEKGHESFPAYST